MYVPFVYFLWIDTFCRIRIRKIFVMSLEFVRDCMAEKPSNTDLHKPALKSTARKYISLIRSKPDKAKCDVCNVEWSYAKAKGNTSSLHVVSFE